MSLMLIMHVNNATNQLIQKVKVYNKDAATAP